MTAFRRLLVALIISGALAGLFTSYSQAQDSQFRIFVDVQGPRNAEMSSYLKHSLRDINGVAISGSREGATHLLEVLLLESETQSGVRSGYVYSVVGTEPLFIVHTRISLALAGISDSLQTAIGEAVREDLDGGKRIAYHVTGITPPDELSQTAEQIAHDFDGAVLESERR